MKENANCRASRRGFTLTELLVVIAIIAVLASLVSVGVMRALDSAKQTRIKLELDQIDLALKAYKDKFGEYPPCDFRISFTVPPTNTMYNRPLRRHFTRAFPRYNFSATEANGRTKLENDLNKTGIDLSNFRPDQALVFWLQGFGPDPTDPILSLNSKQILSGAETGGIVPRTPLFDFDKSRLVQLTANQIASYVPSGGKNNAPYIYFDAGTYMNETIYPPSTPLHWNAQNAGIQVAGFVMPYFSDDNGNGQPNTPVTTPAGTETWINPETFQLIAPGIDGKYGSTQLDNPNIDRTYRCYPTGNLLLDTTAMVPMGQFRSGYDKQGFDDDNVTNFCNKARLGDARP